MCSCNCFLLSNHIDAPPYSVQIFLLFLFTQGCSTCIFAVVSVPLSPLNPLGIDSHLSLGPGYWLTFVLRHSAWVVQLPFLICTQVLGMSLSSLEFSSLAWGTSSTFYLQGHHKLWHKDHLFLCIAFTMYCVLLSLLPFLIPGELGH